MMKYVSLLALLCAASFNAIGDDHASSKNSEKPMNVVFILADDLGWSDTELYGTTELYKTPNLLRLAERGRTFTRAYSNSPLCSPTRASILTGQSPPRNRSRVGAMNLQIGLDSEHRFRSQYLHEQDTARTRSRNDAGRQSVRCCVA